MDFCGKNGHRAEVSGQCTAVWRLVSRRFYLAQIALFLSVLVSALAGPIDGKTNLVVCPAIEQDELPRSDYPFDSNMRVSLVAMGVVRPVEATNTSERCFELTVDRVIYGSTNGGPVRFSNPWNLVATQHVIVALVPTVYDDPAPFELKYDLPSDELESQTALARARLDYRVLSAQSIFVGKDLAVQGSFFHTVEVIRSLYGPDLKSGERVTVQISDFTPITERVPKVCTNEMIYAIASIDSGKNLRGAPQEVAKEMVYTLLTTFGADQENKVREALARRMSYPTVELEDGGKKLHAREILFDGTSADAISLLGSTSDAAVTLGIRKLKSTRDTLKPIISAVNADLFDFALRPKHGFRRLHNLILLLGDMGQGTATGEIGKCLDTLLGRIESEPPAFGGLPDRPRIEHYWSDEESHDDVNHALAWLMMATKESDLLDKFAQRAIRLRDKVTVSWRQELQLALDAARVEDNLEIQAGKKVAAKTKPLRIGPCISASGETVAFSHDGRYLACGSAVWNTADWSKAGGFTQDGSIDQVIFSTDDKYLYVVGGGRIKIHNRFDWRSGKLDKSFEGHTQNVCYVALTPDGRQMLTVGCEEGVILVWDVKSGKISKSFEIPSGCDSVALSRDGTTLARQTEAHEITLQSLTLGSKATLHLPEDELCGVTFSPDGNFFLAATFGFASEVSMQHVVHLLAYDVAAGLKKVAEATQPANRCVSIAVSPDSKQVVFSDQDGRAWHVSLPHLNVVAPLITTKRIGARRSGIAFSPDGKILAVGSHDDAVQLFDARTFERIRFPSGHSGLVKSVFFSNDGKSLRSLGTDDTVCLWDAGTGKMKQRFSLPKGTTCVSMRPDGRYVLCASGLDVETPFWDQKNKVPPVVVFDLEMGNEVSEVELPVNWSATATKVLWLSEPEALCLADGFARRVNYLTGGLVKTNGFDINKHNLLYNGIADVTEDGKTLYSIDGGYKASHVRLEKFEVATEEFSTIGSAELPRVTGNGRGLIPGGQYFFIGDPGMYIYDRESVKLVSQKRMKDWDLLHTCYSSKGSYYAVAAGARRFVGHNFAVYEPNVETVVRVQETLTGKTIFAFPAHSRWVNDMKFSPDAKQLAVATDDGFIEVWRTDLPKP